MRVRHAAAISCLTLALFCASAEAQITRGAIFGTIRDTSDAMVPGVAITVTNMDTNGARTTISDATGFFRVAALDPGRYVVVTDMSGFAAVEVKDVTVRTATDVSLDIELKVARVGEAVTVTARTTAIELNKANPTIGVTLNSRQVVELPLPGGRNLNNLILTAPNASSVVGQGTYAANGQRSRNNNYMVDESDNNDITLTGSTSQLVPEAVAEFQVLTNPYNVEFGRNTGAQVNVITKSGTNSMHADVWDYYTSSRFYSLTNIEKANNLTSPARFNRHQWGFDAGGAVVKNKTFFYGLFQDDLQRPGPTLGATVRMPTAAGFAALQGVPLGAGQTAASRAAVTDRLSFLNALYGAGLTFRNLATQLVNGVPIETGQTNINRMSPSTYKSYMGRVDHRLTVNDHLTVRYSYAPRTDLNVVSNCVLGDVFCGFLDLKDTNLAISDSHVLNSQLLNEYRFSLVRRDIISQENDPKSPTAAISGLFTVGGLNNYPLNSFSDAYQFTDTFSRTRERHTLKFGADIRYNKLDNVAAFDSKGTFIFNSLQDYMNNLAFSYAQALQTSSFLAKQWQTSFFVQDDFRATPELTVNMGLRYEVSTVPLGFFGATEAGPLGALVPAPVKTDKNNWAPRIGFAWSPRSQNRFIGDGTTVLRGGFGIGYDVLFYNLLTTYASNYPRVVTQLQNNVQNVYPNITQATGSAVFDPLAAFTNAPENAQSPKSRFYSVSMQREVGTTVIEVGYTGSRGYLGINQWHMNPAILTPAQAALVASTQSSSAIPNVQARRLYPQYGARTVIPAYVGPGGGDAEARSTYDALVISANKRYSRGLQMGGSYTYSRWYSNNDASLSENGTDGSSQRPQSFFDIGPEWSRSQFDRPHRFTMNYVWEIPGFRTGILGSVMGGWQIAGVTQAQSGRPFTITTGVDSNGDGTVGSDRPNINPAGTIVWDADHKSFVNNGYYVAPVGTNNLPIANGLGNGNAPRNGERGAGFANTDASLMKRFAFGDRQLVVRGDVFNAFNQPSYGIPVATMTSASFGQNTNSWGRRSVQLSAKIIW